LEALLFFTFPEDAHWNADRQAVEFGVEIGECTGFPGAYSDGYRRGDYRPSGALNPTTCD
jgi:hypothetical protein